MNEVKRVMIRKELRNLYGKTELVREKRNQNINLGYGKYEISIAYFLYTDLESNDGQKAAGC